MATNTYTHTHSLTTLTTHTHRDYTGHTVMQRDTQPHTHRHTDTETQRHTHRDSNPHNAQPKPEVSTTSETWAHSLNVPKAIRASQPSVMPRPSRKHRPPIPCSKPAVPTKWPNQTDIIASPPPHDAQPKPEMPTTWASWRGGLANLPVWLALLVGNWLPAGNVSRALRWLVFPAWAGHRDGVTC